MKTTFSALALAAFLSTGAAQYGGDWGLVTVNNPGVVYDEPGRDVIIAAGRMPDLTAHQNFSDWANNKPLDGTWDWRINITNISVPTRLNDLGKPTADYSQNLSLINTQWQLNWPAVADGKNQSLEEYLQRTYGNSTNLYYGAYAIPLPPDAYTQIQRKTSGRNFNCSTVLNSTCLADLRSAVASRNLASLSDIKSCEDVSQYEKLGIKGGFGLRVDINASDWNGTEASYFNYPNTTLVAYTNPETSGGNYTYFNRAITTLNILTLALEYPITNGRLTTPDVQCQIVGIETGYTISAGVRPSAATGLAMLAFLGTLAFLSL